jgi:putative transcriptional regulator
MRRLALIFSLAALSPPAFPAEGVANAIFLVASTSLKEPTFRQTVVLVTQPARGGPWGVIINRPLEQRLGEVFTEYETLKDRKEVLHFGGPVQRDGLVFLVRTSAPPPRAAPVLHDVYFVSDLDWIDGLFRRPEPTQGLRVYHGYSAWAPGQLQKELERGGWHVVPADAATVFDTDPARIWPELIQRAGTKQTRRDEGGGQRDEAASLRATGHAHPPSLVAHRAFPTSGASR